MVDQEVEIGLRAIAVPILNAHGKTVAALNIGLAATQVHTQDIIDDYLPALLLAQSGIARGLH